MYKDKSGRVFRTVLCRSETAAGPGAQEAVRFAHLRSDGRKNALCGMTTSDPIVVRTDYRFDCADPEYIPQGFPGPYPPCLACSTMAVEMTLQPASREINSIPGIDFIQDFYAHPFDARRVHRYYGMTLPMPEKKALIEVDMAFSQREYEQLRLGSIPRGMFAMDCKWGAYLESRCLHLHRSWSGVCAYQVYLESSGKDYRIAEVWVNRDPEQTSPFFFGKELLIEVIQALVEGKAP